MFILSYVQNCTHPAASNSTPEHTEQVQLVQEVPVLIGGILAFLGHSLALMVLCRSRAAVRLGSIRLNLAILSSAELALSIFVIGYALKNIVLMDMEPKTVPQLIYIYVLLWNINALICSRNWFVALIALSRCEAIFRPMESLSNQFFSKKRIICYIIGFYLLSYTFAAIRNLSTYGQFCLQDNSITQVELLIRYRAFVYFETYCVFAYQSVLPIFIVFIATILMIYTLLSKNPLVEVGQIGGSNQSRQNFQRKATRTVLMLAIVFTTMEAPIFLFKLLHMILSLPHKLAVDVLFYIGRLLVVLDSCCNVVIYVLTSDRFRAELWRLLRDIRRCFRGTGNGGTGGEMVNRNGYSNSNQELYTVRTQKSLLQKGTIATGSK